MAEARKSTKRVADSSESEPVEAAAPAAAAAPVDPPADGGGGDAPVSVPMIAVERLISESDAFLGHPSHVAAGALAGCGASEMSADDARRIVEIWLNRPVEEG